MHLEAAKAERPLEDKGHDRIVILEALGRFAVFDGAGQAIASSLAAKSFNDQHEHEVPLLREAFINVQARLMGYQDNLSDEYKYLRGMILTTGTAIGISPNSDKFEYAHAGDSAMYMYDFDSARLSAVTRQEVIGHRADVDNFLGSPSHILTQHGEEDLSEHVAFTLFTDGVGDKANPKGAISEEGIGEILAADIPCQQKANQIIEASSISDDRAVVVIDYRR